MKNITPIELIFLYSLIFSKKLLKKTKDYSKSSGMSGNQINKSNIRKATSSNLDIGNSES